MYAIFEKFYSPYFIYQTAKPKLSQLYPQLNFGKLQLRDNYHIVQTLTHKLSMIDSDQSYLLKSYNENEPLFANTNPWSDLTKSNKISHQDFLEYQNNQKNPRKRWRSNQSVGKQKKTIFDQNIDLNVPMLDSIYEDYRENQNTASKTKLSNNKRQYLDEPIKQETKKQKNLPKLSSKPLKSRKNSDSNLIGNNILSQQKLTFRIKEDNFSSCSFGLRQQKISSEDEDLDIQIAQYFCKKVKNESQSKIDQISQFFVQICCRYSNLARKLEVYEKLVSDLEQIITKQNKVLNNLSRENQNFTKKIEKMNYFQCSIYGQIITEHRNTLNVISSQIVHVIQEKVYNHQIQNSTIKNQKFVKNNLDSNHSINYVQPAINYTKSVPVFTKLTDNQNTQQTPKIQEDKNMNYKSNENTIFYNQTCGRNSDLSNEKQEYQNQVKYLQEQKIKIKQQLQKLKNLEPVQQNFVDRVDCRKKQIQITDFYRNNQRCQQTSQKAGQAFRKLANLRTKQLQTQNQNLRNQIQSSNVKLMVIKNQNKQLRDIIQQLIKQVQRLTSQQSYHVDVKYCR